MTVKPLSHRSIADVPAVCWNESPFLTRYQGTCIRIRIRIRIGGKGKKSRPGMVVVVICVVKGYLVFAASICTSRSVVVTFQTMQEQLCSRRRGMDQRIVFGGKKTLIGKTACFDVVLVRRGK
jgi:hypoxanthine-guanine phosphoribosyltransferase